MFGFHPAVHWRTWAVNIPYKPHKIIVAGLGTPDRRGRWHPWRPYAHRMTLEWCCPRRAAETVKALRLTP